ncbi:MAG TPA: phospho-N-acetylmuramoyl-pentapeptide-transferase [Opitutae bacterium]|nr:phospho-N-acetylmuramoyl-pentapeptide-transferase [Opitutae bacterium]
MLTYLADFEHYFGPLRLFKYLTVRCVLAAITALFLSFLIAPWLLVRLRALKVSQSFRDASEVRELAELHRGKQNTPTMGGLMIYVALAMSVLLWAEPNIYVLTALVVYTGLTIIGFWDDYLKVVKKTSKGLSGRKKLLGQVGVTLLAMVLLYGNSGSHFYMSQLWVPFYKNPLVWEMPLAFIFVFLFLVLAGSSNAINLTDGVDGLAIGCTVTVALVYALMAYAAGNIIVADYLFIGYIPGSGELAVVCAALVGAALAFLWYNAHPAEVFMGDTGSLALGGLIGIIAFMVQQPFTLVIVGGIFVIEAISVILQVSSFKLLGKRIFRMAPLHHHFELKDWHETKVVIRFWILSLIFAMAGLSTLKLR